MTEQSEHQVIEQRQLAASWEDYSRDTAPDIDRRQLAAAWNAPAWRKLWMAAEMSQVARDLTLAGLRRRHPNADNLGVDDLLQRAFEAYQPQSDDPENER